MPSLTFAALLSNDRDTTMEDAPPLCTELPTIQVIPPIDFDFNFELENTDLRPRSEPEVLSSSDDFDPELRSPRTPTYKGGSYDSSDPLSPFDADKYFSFPLLELSGEPSALAGLSQSVAAKSHSDIHLPFIDVASDHPLDLPSPPRSPLLWIWTCHLCRSRYPLGVTRRCLVDGHYYCSGDVSSAAAQRNVKKKKRGQACSSEFDYVGWQEWGDWRKQVAKLKQRDNAGTETPSSLKGCQACEYPSECRHRKMNKIPDVVVSVSKKLDSKAEGLGKTGEEFGVVPKKSDMKTEKKKNLKVDTGSSSLRRRKTKDGQGGVSGTTTTSSNCTSRSDCRVKTETAVKDGQGSRKSSSPLSPDLVDFSALIVTPEHQHNEIRNHEEHDNGKASTSSSKLLGSASLTCATGRRRSEIDEKHMSRQSRISDFFSLKS